MPDMETLNPQSNPSAQTPSLEKQAIWIVLGVIGVVAAVGAVLLRTRAGETTLSGGGLQQANQAVSGANAQRTGAPMAELKIEELTVGTGPEVRAGDVIRMHYRGTLEDGKEFDSSYRRGEPFQAQIGVGQVIKGWDEGVIGMRVGGKRRLIIPPEKGYGLSGAGNVIPPNATLTFELELVSIETKR